MRAPSKRHCVTRYAPTPRPPRYSDGDGNTYAFDGVADCFGVSRLRHVPPIPLPPYATAPVQFPFRALAAQAGRAPIGGAREVALACLMAARLSSGVLPPVPLPLPARAARRQSARTWFATLAVPAALRAPLARLADAAAREGPRGVAAALGSVLGAARRQLDPASAGELEELITRLSAQEVS